MTDSITFPFLTSETPFIPDVDLTSYYNVWDADNIEILVTYLNSQSGCSPNIIIDSDWVDDGDVDEKTALGYSNKDEIILRYPIVGILLHEYAHVWHMTNGGGSEHNSAWLKYLELTWSHAIRAVKDQTVESVFLSPRYIALYIGIMTKKYPLEKWQHDLEGRFGDILEVYREGCIVTYDSLTDNSSLEDEIKLR